MPPGGTGGAGPDVTTGFLAHVLMSEEPAGQEPKSGQEAFSEIPCGLKQSRQGAELQQGRAQS